MTESTSHVELEIQRRIQAARVKVQAARERRAGFAEARRAGLARRHAAKLRALAEAEERRAFCDGCNGTAETHEQITHDPWCSDDLRDVSGSGHVSVPDTTAD
ncbi:regulator of protease activity HflC (stomatin/prohibitin superfamily) [Streptomyces achromogenes]|uniref:hypothetical protein n=1 Tax=Streptomyces achromogenes TaxID=67255 RepID=UPI00278B3C04|nr:hypothetical protein [Streptomyces achromogenes]MDQ0831946.1 regulator of protease activity HflC (stomatin/prohibitin superfamily) [Streptomyces achromogenes]